MTRLTSGVSWLSSRLRSASSVTVTYRRGNDSIDGLNVVPARVLADEYGDGASSITALDKDWICLAEHFVIGGVKTLPQRNDEIDRIDGGVTRTYRVLQRPNDRVFRYTDQTELQLRIYTVEQVPNSE